MRKSETPAATAATQKEKLEKANALAEIKAAELSTKLKCVVHPMVFVAAGSEDIIVGYLKEPPRFMKLKTMDQAITAPYTAASSLVDACLIREESDPRIYSEDPANDAFYIGATDCAYNLVKLAINQFKKK